MKNAVAILFALVTLNAWAAPNLAQKVSLKAKSVTAGEVLKEVSTRTNVKFNISPKITFTKKVSINVKDASLKDVLDFLVAEQNVTWTAGEDNSINITAAN